MPAPVLQFKRGNAGVAGTVPALRPGEPAISLNNFDFFIGIDTSVANNKFFGSHRYWQREDGDKSLRLRLVDRTGNVENSIQLKTPDSHTGITTYTFPSTPAAGNVLATDESGDLYWTTGFDKLDIINLFVSGISTFTGAITANGNVTLGDNSSDTLTVNGTSTFNSPTTFLSTLTGTISTATRATTVDTTETSTAAEFYPTFVSTSASTQSQTVRTDAGISYNPNTDTLTVPNIKTTNLKHSNGTQAVAIDGSGNVGISSNLTITGDLFVNGNTTSVNTTTLNVKDSLVDLGLIDTGGGVLGVPTSDLNIDVGVIFNYFDTEARKASVYWDDSVSRIAIASRVAETNSILTASAYAALEVGGLWVNNACTGGAAEVISCFGGTELEVRNVLIDAGTF